MCKILCIFAPKYWFVLDRIGIISEFTHCLLGVFVFSGVSSSFVSCKQKSEEKIVAPWGEVVDSIPKDDHFDLEQIVSNGEMIMLTLSGPETYYDYHGSSLGTQYMLCQKFADKMGVSLRVEVCRDTTEMLRKLMAGEADIIACQLDKRKLRIDKDSLDDMIFCGAGTDSTGVHWVVSNEKPLLAKALDKWYRPGMLAEVKREEDFFLSTRSIRRHVYAPMLNRKGGIISRYDGLFMTYSRAIRWDWKLMAAQSYQESTFDPQAKSWAGACGLMQIMPSTASDLGLPMTQIHDPESNIAAAAKLLDQLEAKFRDVPGRQERIKFVLASYNGGYHHVRDAMALTTKHGGNKYSWNDVSKYILLLSSPQYYRDPVVRFGYMRGSETVDYVSKIHQRWHSYRGVKTVRGGMSDFSGMTPRKATHRRKKKYNI